jgi:glycosyltransferase involved in cell wall biosynthesis
MRPEKFTAQQPLFSVIIPHLNQPEELDACLSSLQAQALEGFSFEIIVVDNDSRSLPAKITDRYPGTLLLREPTSGPGPARNRGVQSARGKILAFIDADCRANPNWLRSALQALEQSPPRTILGGDVQIWHEPNSVVTAVEAYESVFAYRFKLYMEQHGFCGTGNLVVLRTDFESIGQFRGIEVAEDIDWGNRALAVGYCFRYVPSMIVYHPPRKSFRELCVKWDRHIQHAINARPDDVAWHWRWLVRAFAILVSPAVDWTKVVRSGRVKGALPALKAITVLTAIRVYRAYKMVSLLFSGKDVHWNRERTSLKSDGYHNAS